MHELFLWKSKFYEQRKGLSPPHPLLPTLSPFWTAEWVVTSMVATTVVPSPSPLPHPSPLPPHLPLPAPHLSASLSGLCTAPPPWPFTLRLCLEPSRPRTSMQTFQTTLTNPASLLSTPDSVPRMDRSRHRGGPQMLWCLALIGRDVPEHISMLSCKHFSGVLGSFLRAALTKDRTPGDWNSTDLSFPVLGASSDAEAEAPILWPPDVKSWLIGKDLDAGKGWRWEEKGTTEDEMVGWHHQLNGHEFEQALGDGEGQGSLACCSPWGRRDGHDWVTEQQALEASSLRWRCGQSSAPASGGSRNPWACGRVPLASASIFTCPHFLPCVSALCVTIEHWTLDLGPCG